MTERTKKNKPTVLVIEDEPALSEIFTMALEMDGFRVERAFDGVEGLDKAIHLKPDIIILDLLMPIKDGFDVLGDLKSNEGTVGIPVVILSNLGQDFERQRGLEMGAVCFYTKTDLDQGQLGSLLRSVMAGTGCNIAARE
ncbi:response regulator [Candidatus Uhrbacteria bacterium]|nr:response regulator [Candidatus Uhrbacteria bacterium]